MSLTLHVTMTSPYARMVRIVVLEKGLQDRVEIVPAQTRRPDSPYYTINPSGRVPFLVREDAPALEGSRLICEWLDHLDGAPAFALPEGPARWEALRLQELAMSLMDGLSVWGRELYRPMDERSPTIIAHEQARAGRLISHWATDIAHPHMNGSLNMAQIMLATALDLDRRNPQFQWRTEHPTLAHWLTQIDHRPSFENTRPDEAIAVA